MIRSPRPGYIGRTEIDAAQVALRQWQPPACFQVTLAGILDRMLSAQLFRQGSLADEEAWDAWLTGAVEEALDMQRPCPPESLAVVHIGAAM